MSKVKLFEEIRREHRDGASIRGLADSHGVHRRTVRQAIRDAVPPVRKTSERDVDFNTDGFREMLSSFGRFTAADFGIDQAEHDRLRTRGCDVAERPRSDLSANHLSAAKVLTDDSRAKHQFGAVDFT